MNSMLLKLGIFFIAIGIAKFIYAMYLKHKDTFNKLGYKAKINTHTTSYIN